ncbi:MAG: sensor histidine kinase [Oligoflexus sp.]
MANQIKSQFIANISHEIRTPLAAILSYAELLTEKVNDRDSLANLHIIRQNGRFLLDIINDVLDLSKIEAGKLLLHMEVFSPKAILSDLYDLMKLRAQEKGIVFDVQIVGLLPSSIISDSLRIKQVLLNLTGNAFKFTQRGWVHVEARYSEQSSCSFLCFDVIDTGIGISKNEIKGLFKPYSQLQVKNAVNSGGTGLGLMICKHLIERLHGTITVDSNANRGSRFTVKIPVKKDESINSPMAYHSSNKI